MTDTVTTITLPYLSHSRTDQIIILETLLETYVKNMKTYILKHNVVQTPRVHTPIPSDLPPFTAIITTYHKAIHTENLHAYVCSPNFFLFFFIFFYLFIFFLLHGPRDAIHTALPIQDRQFPPGAVLSI